VTERPYEDTIGAKYVTERPYEVVLLNRRGYLALSHKITSCILSPTAFLIHDSFLKMESSY